MSRRGLFASLIIVLCVLCGAAAAVASATDCKLGETLPHLLRMDFGQFLSDVFLSHKNHSCLHFVADARQTGRFLRAQLRAAGSLPPMPQIAADFRRQSDFVHRTTVASLQQIAAHYASGKLTAAQARQQIRATVGHAFAGLQLAVDTDTSAGRANMWDHIRATDRQIRMFLTTYAAKAVHEVWTRVSTVCQDRWASGGRDITEFDTYFSRVLIASLVPLTSFFDPNCSAVALPSEAEVPRGANLSVCTASSSAAGLPSFVVSHCGLAVGHDGMIGSAGVHLDLRSKPFVNQGPVNGRLWIVLRPEVSCRSYAKLCRPERFGPASQVAGRRLATTFGAACAHVCYGDLLRNASAYALHWYRVKLHFARTSAIGTVIGPLSTGTSGAPVKVVHVKADDFRMLALWTADAVLDSEDADTATMLVSTSHIIIVDVPRWGPQPNENAAWWLYSWNAMFTRRFGVVLLDRTDLWRSVAARVVYMKMSLWAELDTLSLNEWEEFLLS